MQKFNTEKGCRFSCGWLPPKLVIVLGCSVVVWVTGLYCGALMDASRLPAGTFVVLAEDVAWAKWLCAGISPRVTVWNS